MSANSFFPTSEAEQVIWLLNYLANLPNHYRDCGISEEEFTRTVNDLDYYVWVLQHWHPGKQRDAKESTAYKMLIVEGNGSEPAKLPQEPIFPEPPPAPVPGVQRRLFKQIARIKASAAYNDAVGHDLGVIAVAEMAEHPLPEFSATVDLGADGPRVRIDFRKYGHDGIWIESRSNGGDWSFLAISTLKPHFDERPLPAGNNHETREYRLRWWDKSAPHGAWSAVQRAVLAR